MRAPDFSLPDQTETVRSLADYAGSWLVLYFYPKDDTPGCTVEACSFRDSWGTFAKQNVQVVGVSADSPRKHRNFTAKYGLPFSLLSDPELAAIKAYHAWGPKKLFGREYHGIIRKTILIGPTGEIAKEYPQVTPAGHAAQLLADIAQLS
jgi:peroxiredoxin Q/BCP